MITDHREFRGMIVDVISGRIFPGAVVVRDQKIISVAEASGDVPRGRFITPVIGSAHTHIESSMLPPSEFARHAMAFGEGFGVHDPHEIANVLGVLGVEWMIQDGKNSSFHFCWGAPSCVPESPLVRTAAVIDADDVRYLLSKPEIAYLSEVMAFPLVLAGEPQIMSKIAAAKAAGKPIDGHAPGLRGSDAARYAAAGISTDHECVSLEEARDKLNAGMKILVREGSAAKNYSALCELLHSHPDRVMFCSDDIHPDDLLRGHMDTLIRRAIGDGVPAMSAIRAASRNTIQHYGLPVGLLQPGDRADFLIVEDLKDFRVKETYLQGILVAKDGKSLEAAAKPEPVNAFQHYPLSIDDFSIPARRGRVRVIEVYDGQLITGQHVTEPKISGNELVADLERDILFLAVVDRVTPSKPALGFVRNFGLKGGALASSVAHDSHHVIAVGTSKQELFHAIEAVRKAGGGISAVREGEELILPLVHAGLMSSDSGEIVAERYETLDRFAKSMGSPLRAPFMTLSFLVLTVIPSLKMSNFGLVDVEQFTSCELFV